MPGEGLFAAQSTISDLSGFCDRNPETCATGGQAIARIGERRRSAPRSSSTIWMPTARWSPARPGRFRRPIWNRHGRSTCRPPRRGRRLRRPWLRLPPRPSTSRRTRIRCGRGLEPDQRNRKIFHTYSRRAPQTDVCANTWRVFPPAAGE
ncbi:MAG: DUF5330 domain-containing protein [Alphaproteobacteria bacterium]|nr:DUF5330 domain-containing protein [Alphaproteobacteria bacterium]